MKQFLPGYEYRMQLGLERKLTLLQSGNIKLHVLNRAPRQTEIRSNGTVRVGVVRIKFEFQKVKGTLNSKKKSPADLATNFG